MSVGPPLSGSSLAFALTVLKDVFVYIKHKRRRVIDLLDDFVELKGEVDDLLERWGDINDEIKRQSTSIEKSRQHITMEKKVSRMETKFDQIEGLYRVLCRDLESRVRAASGSDAAGTEEQRSQEAENGNRTNARGSANDNRADIGRQKIWSRNFFKLARLDKDVVKLTPEVIAVKKELVPGDLTKQAKPKIVERMTAEELGKILPSRQKHLDDLLQYVQQETCKRIGIYGAPGVGTTNILKSLNNCFDSSSPTYCGCSVGYVIWVTVPEENNQEKLIKTIQEEIIERLKITGGKRIKSRDRDIISSFLAEKKYLLLLDDFSPLVKLEDIGIIEEEHEQGKVVMAAKSSHALRKIKSYIPVEIKSLSLPEAHALFKHFIDDYDELSLEHKDMAHPIVEQLGGLPEFIKLTAQYLNRHRQLLDWRGIKEQSRSGVHIPQLLGMATVIESYKKVYEDLRQNYVQKCLLYAALFPSRYRICRNTLVECWKGENFLDCRPPTLNAARAAGQLVFNQLASSCLLESFGERYVKMSVFFRKVAFHISFPEEGDGALTVRSGSNIDGDLEEKQWSKARRVSLIRNNLGPQSLPTSPNCKDISTLFLQQNPNLTEIQSGFFNNMKTLRVLNLQGTGITSLPSSISNLIALRSLYLNDCGGLNELPTTINQLKELEVLDIRGTAIPCLPAEILNVASLRCLRISFSSKNCNLTAGSKRWRFLNLWRFARNQSWVIFPPDAHTKLSNLEEMAIDLRGEVSDQVLYEIKKEAAEFVIREGFKFELGAPPGQSSGPYSEASEDETGELSNVAQGRARSPSNVDERLAGSSLSAAVVLQSNHGEISDGQNTTSLSHSQGQNASPYSGCLGRPWVRSSREDKGKAVAKPPGRQRKKTAKPLVQSHHQQGLKIRELASETNNTAATLSDTDDDERVESDVDDQLQRALKNADDHRGLDRLAGEGTSASH